MPLSEVIDLIHSFQTYLEEESPTAFLSTPEDAQYFRNAVRKRRAEGKAEDAEKIEPPSRERAMPQPLKKVFEPPFSSPIEPRLEPKKELLQPSQIALEEPEPKSPPPFVEKPTPKRAESLAAEKSIARASLADVRKIFAPLFPQFPLLDSIPSDAIAIKIAERWKTKNKTAPISILSLNEPPEQRTLLEQIAKAIDATFAPARVIGAEPIEKEKQWEAFLSAPGLKAAIACDSTLWQLNHLMSYYKENPAQGNRTLGSIPLFLLPDLSLYLKDPLLKRSLWKALCQKLSS
jgi:hypothetical protein